MQNDENDSEQIQIIVIDKKVIKGFNKQAIDQLRSVIFNFTEEVIREANRIEATHNNIGTEPEITSGMISKAEILIKNNLGKPKKKFFPKICNIAASIFGIITGGIFNLKELNQSSTFIPFIIFLLLTIFALIGGWKDE